MDGHPYIGCNDDAMTMAPKGVIGVRMDGADEVEFQHLDIYNLRESSDPGSRVCGDYWDADFSRFEGGGHPFQSPPYLYGYTGNMAHGIMSDWSQFALDGLIDIHHIYSRTGLVRGIGLYTNSEVIYYSEDGEEVQESNESNDGNESHPDHVRGQDWDPEDNEEEDEDDQVEAVAVEKHPDHVRGEDWDPEVWSICLYFNLYTIYVLYTQNEDEDENEEAVEVDEHPDHVRGQDWNPENEDEDEQGVQAVLGAAPQQEQEGHVRGQDRDETVDEEAEETDIGYPQNVGHWEPEEAAEEQSDHVRGENWDQLGDAQEDNEDVDIEYVEQEGNEEYPQNVGHWDMNQGDDVKLGVED